MPTVVRVGHSYDGPNWTVAQMVKAPSRLPNVVVQAVKDNLIADLLLRKGPAAPGGAVQYEEQVVFSSLREDEIVAEFGEIPMTQAGVSVPMMVATQKRGLGLKVSKEMVTRNDTGQVARDIGLTKEQLIRGWNKVFFTAVNTNPNILTMPASNAGSGGWTDNSVNAGIRRDIADARFLMANQTVQGAVDNDKYGYRPDTLILHPTMEAEFIDHDEINRVFENSPATTISPRYLLKAPTKLGDLDIIYSWEIDPTTALMVKRNTMGFISDEWPLSGSPTEYTEREQTYATYFTRRSLVAIDVPKSVLKITGIS